MLFFFVHPVVPKSQSGNLSYEIYSHSVTLQYEKGAVAIKATHESFDFSRDFFLKKMLTQLQGKTEWEQSKYDEKQNDML